MLRRLTVHGFKSLNDVTVEFPRMAVLFGPNAAGKSNLLDAIQALSRIATSRTLSDALSDIRGYPIEAFSFPPGGLASLLGQGSPVFALKADIDAANEHYRYGVEVEIRLSSGALTVRDDFLDPRVAMRAAQPPSDVRDIGVLGGEIAPFLYRLRAEHRKHFDAVARALRSIVPSVEELTVDLDRRRGTLDILIRQGGVDYSSRIASEGTLRVLALCAIAVNPWGGSLLAFEEPENGVHPRRLELIAQLLGSLALEQGRQVVVTTHSPLFCDAVLKGARARTSDVGLFNVRREGRATVVKPFDVSGPLFKDREIAAALTGGTEDGLFESLLLRGMLDE
jgi:predicted ATPase